MMNLAEYRRRSQSLSDFLPWAALVETGVILNKDGSFQRTARFRGPDLDSATPSELVSITARLNNALRRLGSGWAIFVEAQRVPTSLYPQSSFPDAVSRLVEAERRAQFEEAGAHFESRYFLTLVWLPPAQDAARAENWLYEGRAGEGADWRSALALFQWLQHHRKLSGEFVTLDMNWLDFASGTDENFANYWYGEISNHNPPHGERRAPLLEVLIVLPATVGRILSSTWIWLRALTFMELPPTVI